MVTMPIGVLTRNEEAKARPSVKLCVMSAERSSRLDLMICSDTNSCRLTGKVEEAAHFDAFLNGLLVLLVLVLLLLLLLAFLDLGLLLE